MDSRSQRGHECPAGDEDQDERTQAPERGAGFVIARAKIRGEVKQAGHDETVQQDAREHQRRPAQHEQQSGHEEIRQALQVILLDAPNPLDSFVGTGLRGIGFRIEQRLARVFRRTETAFLLHHAACARSPGFRSPCP